MFVILKNHKIYSLEFQDRQSGRCVVSRQIQRYSRQVLGIMRTRFNTLYIQTDTYLINQEYKESVCIKNHSRKS